MIRTYHRRSSRRGQAITEWYVIFGFIVVAAFWYLGSLGNSVDEQLQDAAGQVVEPSQLNDYFSRMSARQNGGKSGTASTPGKSGATGGNNGVGNGEDAQPLGNPPVNDGAGSGPGNPGNRGGVNK